MLTDLPPGFHFHISSPFPEHPSHVCCGKYASSGSCASHKAHARVCLLLFYEPPPTRACPSVRGRRTAGEPSPIAATASFASSSNAGSALNDVWTPRESTGWRRSKSHHP